MLYLRFFITSTAMQEASPMEAPTPSEDRLKLYLPKSKGDQEPQVTQAGSRSGTEPIPIQYRLEEVQTVDGPCTHQYTLWWNEDGARCRQCPPGTCTFSPTSTGVGTCLVKRIGKLAGSLPSALGD